MNIMVTGHRPQHIPVGAEAYVKAAFVLFLNAVACECALPVSGVMLISGMAVGSDQWCAEAALDVGAPVWAAIPFPGQENVWGKVAQDRYRKTLARCTQKHMVSSRAPLDSRDATRMLLARDAWMVERAQAAFAVWSGKRSGGTFHTLEGLVSHNVRTGVLLVPPGGQWECVDLTTAYTRTGRAA